MKLLLGDCLEILPKLGIMKLPEIVLDNRLIYIYVFLVRIKNYPYCASPDCLSIKWVKTIFQKINKIIPEVIRCFLQDGWLIIVFDQPSQSEDFLK